MRQARSIWGLWTLALAAWVGVASAQEVVVTVRPRPLPADVTPRVGLSSCGIWTGFYGPIDYRTAEITTRRRVETYHFDEYFPRFLAWPARRPFDSTIAANFSYTLRAFPNHPTTLLAMEQIGRRLRSEDIPGSTYPLECWYLRALQTVPDDPMVRAQYGIYLAFRGRAAEARVNLDAGDAGLCTSRTMQYQIGLANLNLRAYTAAQKNAMRAKRLGLDLPAVERGLRDAGKWDDKLKLPDGDLMGCDLGKLGTAPVELSELKK